MYSMRMTWTKTQYDAAPSVQETAAFEALFQQHWLHICQALFRLTGDWHEAEDLAMEAFVRLYEQPPVDARNLGGWLYRVATNLGLNALRARKRRMWYETQAAKDPTDGASALGYSVDPVETVEQAQECQRVRAVLQRMKTRSAMLLLLRQSGLSYREIATALEITPSSVGVFLARAEKEFEKKYRQLDEL
jgi:RNA polymerase sigma factor (sigma-70 family)